MRAAPARAAPALRPAVDPAAAAACTKNLTNGYDVTSPALCPAFPSGTSTPDVGSCCALSNSTANCPSFVYVNSSKMCYLLNGFGGWGPSDTDHTIGHDGPLPPTPPPPPPNPNDCKWACGLLSLAPQPR